MCTSWYVLKVGVACCFSHFHCSSNNERIKNWQQQQQYKRIVRLGEETTLQLILLIYIGWQAIECNLMVAPEKC